MAAAKIMHVINAVATVGAEIIGSRSGKPKIGRIKSPVDLSS